MTAKEVKLTSQRADVLNISPEMVDYFIRKAEEDISILTEKQQGIFEKLEESKELYLSYKTPYDEWQKEIDKLFFTLETLIGFKQNKNDRKKIKVLHSISNTEQKQHRSPQVRWAKLMEATLRNEGVFLSYESIIGKIIQGHPVLQSRKNDVGFQHAINNNKFAAKKNKSLILYNGKFGLREWAYADGTPLPEYMKEFMFQKPATAEPNY